MKRFLLLSLCALCLAATTAFTADKSIVEKNTVTFITHVDPKHLSVSVTLYEEIDSSTLHEIATWEAHHNGVCEITGLSGGNYTVRAFAEGYIEHGTTVSKDGTAPTTYIIDIKMAKLVK